MKIMTNLSKEKKSKVKKAKNEKDYETMLLQMLEEEFKK